MPAVGAQVLSVTFTGLDTQADPRNAPLGTLLLAENAYQRRKGEWRKRCGVTALTKTTNGAAIAVGKRLAQRGNELVELTDTGVFSYSGVPSGANAFWSDRSKIAGVSMNQAMVSASLLDLYSGLGFGADVKPWVDCAASGGVLCVVYGSSASSTGGFYMLIDHASGRCLTAPVAIGCSQAKVVAAGGYFLIFTTMAVNYIGTVIRINATTRLADAPVNFATDVAGSGLQCLEVQARTDNGTVLVAYRNNSLTPGVTVLRWNPATNALVAGPVTIANTDPSCMGWLDHDFSGTNAYLVTCAGSVVVRALDKSTLTLGTANTVDGPPTTVRNVTGYWDGTSKVLFYELANTTSYNVIIKRGVYTTSASTSTYRRSVGLGSKAFKVGNTYYVLLAYQSTLQATTFLDDTTNDNAPAVLARSLSTIAGGLTAFQSGLPSVCNPTGSQYVAMSGKKIRVREVLSNIIPSVVTYYGATALVYDFADSALGAPKEIGGSLLIPGGAPRLYDGLSTTEAGFHLYPEVPAAPTLAPVGGGLTSGGTYQYRFVYSWVDGSGRLHRSRPSAALTVTAPSGGGYFSATFYVPTLRITSRIDTNSPVYVEVYRTLANLTDFYRHTTVLLNSVTADTTYFVDSLIDSDLATGELLYTSGGGLENYPPPPCRALEVHRSRAVAISSEDPREIWISKLLRAGLGLGWSSSITVRADGNDGPVTALGSFDDKIIVFKRAAVYALAGEGPDDRGAGAYDDPQRVVVGGGCVVPTSVVATPVGLLYLSPKGFRSLSSGAADDYIGAPVDAYNGTLTITGAVVRDEMHQVWWTSAEGRTLVYDWFHRAWSSNTNQAAVAACLWGGTFCYLQSDGTVQQEISGQYNDNGAAISWTLQTNWFNWNRALIQELRLIIGEGPYSGTFNVQLAYDFDPTVVEQVFGYLTSYLARPLTVKPGRERAQALQLTLSEASTGEGLRFSRLDAVVAILPGLEPLESSRVLHL